MSDFLSTETLPISKFMGSESSCKMIPPYQRSYAWNRKQVSNLLTDVKSAMEREARRYFIGAILCVERDEGDMHEVVDGQQRLITLNLIFAAALHIVGQIDDKILSQHKTSQQTIKVKMQEFLYFGGKQLEDMSFFDLKFRLKVNQFDSELFSKIIENGVVTQSKKREKLAMAYQEVCEFLNENIGTEANNAGFLKDFLAFLIEKVYLVNIKISDEENAYEFFEILNARNLPLTPIDLIKNKLFSFLGTNTSENDKKFFFYWTETQKLLKNKHMQNYVRCRLQCERGRMIAPMNLYSELCKIVEGKSDNSQKPEKKAKDLLYDLWTSREKFSALHDENDPFWQGYDSEIRTYVGYLKGYPTNTIMFSILYADLNTEFVFGAYKLLYSFIKRTQTVVDKFTTVTERYEEEFSRLAHRFYSCKYAKLTVSQFLDELKQIDKKILEITSNENFLARFAQPARKIKDKSAKEILVELANHLQRKRQQATRIDLATVSLEHIFPKNPANKADWPGFQNEEISSTYLESLGNLALLEKNRNSSASNKKFSEKKKYYSSENCAIILTNQLCEFPEWSPDSIKEHQSQLAQIAAEVWNFDIVQPSKKRKRA